MVRIGLLSDTHGYLDPRVEHHFRECDEIWHAGDIGSLSVTDELARIAPVRAVYGNIDGHEVRQEFKEDLRFNIEGVSIWLTHIGGRPPRYNARVRPQLAVTRPSAFVCGHSHILCVKYDRTIPCLYLNPGAAGVHGFHKVRTLIRFSISGSEFKDMQVIELGPRAKG
jgi:putative phosphoesterase